MLSTRNNFVCLAVILFLGGVSNCVAQELSRESLMSLQKAHLGDQVIIGQIEKDGVAFDITPAVTVELKNEGFTDAVITALLKSNRRVERPSDLRSLYAQGNYLELSQILLKKVTAEPADYKDRATLVLVLLKASKMDAAEAQLAILQKDSLTAPTAKSFAEQIQRVLASIKKQEQDKRNLLAAISRFDGAEANSIITSMEIGETERELLKANILILQGSFSAAIEKLRGLNSGVSTDSADIASMQEQARAYETQFHDLSARADQFMHSPEAVEMCMAESTAIIRALPLKDFIDSAGKLLSLSPLNPNVINYVFHATLISSPYEKVEQLGDQILASTGKIEVQGYSDDHYFRFVIDERQRSIYTEADPTDFQGLKGRKKVGWNGELVPFSLKYEQIAGISQKAGGSLAGAVWKNPYLLEKGAYALKISPTGQVPQYSMMALLQCSAGQGAQQTATYNLGRFVQHRINNAQLKANLVKPKEVYTDAGAPVLQGLLAFQGSMGGQQAILANVAAAGLAQQMEQERQAAARAQTTWQQLFNRRTFDPARTETFQQLEKVLGIA